MATTFKVRIFRREVDQLLHGRTGPVVLHQANLGRQAAGIARRIAPRDTGTLASTIQSKLVPDRKGYHIELVAGVPYAIYVHQGTRAHFPPPNAVAGWAMRHDFPAKGGAFLVARAISRKAQPRKPFLLEAVRRLGLNARAT